MLQGAIATIPVLLEIAARVKSFIGTLAPSMLLSIFHISSNAASRGLFLQLQRVQRYFSVIDVLLISPSATARIYGGAARAACLNARCEWRRATFEDRLAGCRLQ